ncbi:MAG: DUF4236 domain-containing protein [Wenzhouxiangella sp.]
MTFRFQRRVRLFPGLRLNLSKGGVSLSAGPRGSTVTAGRRGIYGNLGLPGTGLSKRSRLDRSGAARPNSTKGRHSSEAMALELRWPLDANQPSVVDATRNAPLPNHIQTEILAANRSAVIELGLARAEALQARQDAAVHVHRQLTADFSALEALLPPVEAADRPPALLSEKPPSAWLRLIPPLFRRRQQRYELARAAYEQALSQYAQQREQTIARISQQIEQAWRGEQGAREALLSALIEGLDFPFHTEACFSFDGNVLNLDIDLPQEDDLPAAEHGFNQRSLAPTLKPLSGRAVRMNYARHVHALAILLAGVALRSIGSLEMVLLSAFRPAMNPSTGQDEDECLFSVRIDRARWEAIDPERLGELDPIDVLAAFEQHKNMSKTGLFRPVKPLSG